MKLQIILAAILTFLFTGLTQAGDTTYVVSMTGVTCEACQAHVKKAFATLNGVTKDSITIEAGTDKGTHKVTFKSSTDALKKDEAVKSLGDSAKNYVIVTFEPKKEAAK